MSHEAVLDTPVMRELRRKAYQVMARVLMPKPRVRPSEWAEKNIVLSAEESDIPGPYRCTLKPWLAAVHDVKFDNPTKKGVVIVKPSQVMVTRAVLNVAFCYAANDPANMLYMLDTREKSGETAVDKFEKTLAANFTLKELFERQAKVRRATKLNKKFPGGRWDFVGGGSLGPVISQAYRRVFIDEFDRVDKGFPSLETGSVWTVAIGRTMANPDKAELWAFSHPTEWGRGIAERWYSQSDRRVWSFECPHCRARIMLKRFLDLVRIRADDKGALIADTAEMVCPTCDAVVTDAQRAAAVWPAAQGGTGQFVSELEESEARKREYVGLFLHRLADPDVSVVTLSRALASCTSEQDRRGVFTVQLGEPYAMSAVDASSEKIDACVQPMQQIILRGGTGGARICVMGVDVQGQKTDLIFVYQTRVYDASGNCFVVAAGAVSGFDALAAIIRRTYVRIADDDGNEMQPLAPMAVGIDPNHGTEQVLDFCRWQIVNAVSNVDVPRVALRFSDHVDREAPAVMAPDRKRYKPGAEHLGKLDYYYCNRHAWVDRELRRVSEERLRVVCVPPTEFKDHYMSNMLQLVTRRKTWGDEQREEWVKAKDKRDDFMIAGVYGEIVGALRCRLDSLGTDEYAPPVSRDTLAKPTPRGWLSWRSGGRGGMGGGGGRGRW